MSICVRCGYCCKNCCVAVVDNPILGIEENNLIFNEGKNTPCKHLQGSVPGEYACAVHEERWYRHTPCFSYQNEFRHGQDCMLGRSIVDRYLKKRKAIAEVFADMNALTEEEAKAEIAAYKAIAEG